MNNLTDELLNEKSLQDIWWKSTFINVKSRAFLFNTVLLVVVAVLAFAFVCSWDAEIQVIVDALKTLLAGGVSYAITMLGFLLAGFAIMAGVTKPDLWLFMATVQKTPKTSFLKYNLFVYMRVFIYHILQLAAFMVAQLFVYPKTALTKVIWALSDDPAHTKLVVAKVGLALFAVCMAHLLVQLKYFVFNVYHSVMTALAWEVEKPKMDESDSAGHAEQ